MTYDEFQAFMKQLYAGFPAVYEMVKFNSPDMAATHKTWWEKVLKGCTLAECTAVVDAWLSGKYAPPTKDEIKYIAIVIRSIVHRTRDLARKREQGAERLAAYVQLPNTPYTDSNMKRALVVLRPLYAQAVAGEIPMADYIEKKHEMLAGI
jgi:hypothetical protein